MSISNAAATAPAPARSRWSQSRVWRRLRRNPTALAGGLIVLLFIAIAVAAPLLAPYEPNVSSWLTVRKPPTAAHWMGTDDVGRDVMSRLIHGSRASLSAGIISVAIALLIGVPLGVWMARSKLVEGISKTTLDFMQTMPAFVYLIPAVMFFGLGRVPGIIATIIFAMPPAVRLTALGIQQVPAEIVEAARAFGCTDRQLLFRVQLPSARPSIMAGVNQTMMLALSMVVIASMIGAGGLGNVVLQGIQRLDIGLGFKSGLSVVLLAIILDRITQSFGAKVSAPAKSRRAMPAFMHRLMPVPSARSNPTH